LLHERRLLSSSQETKQQNNQPTNQPINQSTNQGTNQLSNKSTNQSNNKPSNNQPIKQSTCCWAIYILCASVDKWSALCCRYCSAEHGIFPLL
jgi:hypothetical protein